MPVASAPKEFDPISFREQLNRSFNLHAFPVVMITVFNLLLQSTDMFSDSIFPAIKNNVTQDDPQTASEFNAQRNGAYFFLIAIPAIYYLGCQITLYWFFREARDKVVDVETSLLPSEEQQSTERCKELVATYARDLQISGEIGVYIIPSSVINACAGKLFPWSKKIVAITTAFLEEVKEGRGSDELTLAHECAHLKNDLLSCSAETAVRMLYALNYAFFIFAPAGFLGQLANLVTNVRCFKSVSPAMGYSLGISTLLGMLTFLLSSHLSRLVETRADFVSLFSELTFNEGEHRKQISLYPAGESHARLFSLFSTHPTNQSRVEMIENACKYTLTKSSREEVLVQMPLDVDESTASLSVPPAR